MSLVFSFVLISIGILIGIFYCHNKYVQKVIPLILHYIIYSLLFFLGSKLGATPHLAETLMTIGKSAFIISIVCMLGSSFAAFLVYKLFFRKSKT